MEDQVEDELSEFRFGQYQDLEDQEENVSIDSTQKQRGAKKVPEQWTHVVSLIRDNLLKIKTYSVASDLLMLQGNQDLMDQERAKGWKPLFIPKGYVQ